jgi:hypothetical protein
VILRINILISAYKINLMVFIMDTDGVLCEVEKDFFYNEMIDCPERVNLYPSGVGI